ncbi:MAG: hypothetical protein QOF11_2616 [Chloroflexota bacterium]|nr:hypothetical protein [Chloroflexota bacterium]
MRSTRISLLVLTVLALVVGACAARTGSSSAPGGGSASAPATTAAPTSEATGVTASALPPASPDAWLAVGRKGVDGLEVILASTREHMLNLPAGVPTGNDWGRIFTATSNDGKTTVRDVAIESEPGGPKVVIDGSWRLPTIGPDPVPVGLSLDGSTLVLMEADRPTGAAAGATTRFAVLHTVPLEGPARILTLEGRFDYDALSPNGSTLFVVEHLDSDTGGRYQVRAVDVASGALDEAVIADKRNVDEQMAGYPLAQVRRGDGLVMTLYQGLEHPFIHALNSIDRWAVCIDLPTSGSDDASAATDWGLAPAPDGSSVYAVNATLGLVAEVDPAQPGLRRSVRVKPLASAGIVLAKFAHQASGPAGRRVVVGPDGKTIYAAGAGGIIALDASTLKAARTYAAGSAVDALAVTPDGGTLYALRHDGHIVKLDAATGALLGTVPGEGFDRLVAVVPW